MVTVEQIKNLRQMTGVSVAQCKRALEEASGNIEKAKTALGAAGAATAEKKSGRALGAGVIGQYAHTGGAMGAMVDLRSETDFVAKNELFVDLANDLAMHVAAFVPADVSELLEQPFIKNPNATVAEVIQNLIQKFGERIEVIRFVRLSVAD